MKGVQSTFLNKSLTIDSQMNKEITGAGLPVLVVSPPDFFQSPLFSCIRDKNRFAFMAKKPSEAKAGVAIHGIAPYKTKKTEDYMNPAQQEHFRSILHAWKHELMEEVDRTMSHMKDEAANFPDPADRATQEEEFAFELRTRDRERRLIRKIDQTLDLIENDEYGWCEQCGVEIGIRRLEARPTATLCIDCKTLDEIKERQIVG